MTAPHVRFARLIKKRGLTYSQVGAVFGVSSVSINDWCHGKRRPSLEFRDAIERWSGPDKPIRSAEWMDAKERAAADRLAAVVAPARPTAA